jgi:GNAT superfamily N-acetyltransferase
MDNGAADEVVIALHRHRPIDPLALKGLFEQERWWPERTATDLVRVLERGPAAGAWYRGRLVGFGRAVTDGVFRAYIEDVVVSADHRGRGVGAALVTALHRELAPVHVISAFFDPSLTDFYARLGYRATRQRVAHRRSGA